MSAKPLVLEVAGPEGVREVRVSSPERVMSVSYTHLTLPTNSRV